MGGACNTHRTENLKGWVHSEDLDVDGKIMTGSYGSRVVTCGLDASGSG